MFKVFVSSLPQPRVRHFLHIRVSSEWDMLFRNQDLSKNCSLEKYHSQLRQTNRRYFYGDFIPLKRGLEKLFYMNNGQSKPKF